MKQDYVFERANDGKVVNSVKFAEPFAGMNTLLLYSFMFGPNLGQDRTTCTSLSQGLRYELGHAVSHTPR